MYWPYLAIVVVFGGLLLYSRRARSRQAAQESQRVSTLEIGSEVMTTSGLYGRIVGRNDDDDTVRLAIAPGVEVKWAVAALRTVDSLPPRYRRGLTEQPPDRPDPPDTGTAG